MGPEREVGVGHHLHIHASSVRKEDDIIKGNAVERKDQDCE